MANVVGTNASENGRLKYHTWLSKFNSAKLLDIDVVLNDRGAAILKIMEDIKK